MMSKRLCVVSVLFVGVLVLFAVIPQSSDQISATPEPTETAGQKRILGKSKYDAFSNNINTCLFQFWTPYAGKNKIPPSLAKGVDCNCGIELCYGPPPAKRNVKRVAQYAACYNPTTFIPEFTGHIVRPNIGGQGRDTVFRADAGVAPVATDDDYKADQSKLYVNQYDSQKQQFFARGHLTPNADFTTDEERAYTMITTNIAPQWQLFNGGNWKNLETALRKYATKKNHALYVFTGTGGKATNEKGDVIKLNKRVLAPKWYWKAVCDPIDKQSVFFLGENTIGGVNGIEDQQAKGCYGKVQTKKLGVIKCYSLNYAKSMFKGVFQIPTFHVENCVPSKIGVNFRPLIEKYLE